MVPVLYASQWFLTLFSCPFPAPFACRLVDTMFDAGSSDILLRARLCLCTPLPAPRLPCRRTGAAVGPRPAHKAARRCSRNCPGAAVLTCSTVGYAWNVLRHGLGLQSRFTLMHCSPQHTVAFNAVICGAVLRSNCSGGCRWQSQCAPSASPS